MNPIVLTIIVGILFLLVVTKLVTCRMQPPEEISEVSKLKVNFEGLRNTSFEHRDQIVSLQTQVSKLKDQNQRLRSRVGRLEWERKNVGK